MSETPQELQAPRIMDGTLTDAQFNVLSNTQGDAPEAEAVRQQLGLAESGAEVAVHVGEDQLGVRTARYIGLTIANQGDVMSLKTIEKYNMPTPSETLQTLATKQAEQLKTAVGRQHILGTTGSVGSAGSR